MQSLKLHAGDVLYREGEPSDAVYFIESGQVEVRRAAIGGPITLAKLGKGEIIGEMGVVRKSPRSASIVATSDAALSRIDGKTFIEAFGGEDGLALKLLRMVCSRLSESNAQNAALTGERVFWDEVLDARLLGDSPETTGVLGNRGVAIRKLPFVVGKSAAGAGRYDDQGFDIAFPGAAAHLDRKHFRIERAEDGHIQLRDLRSRLGCFVNGQRIIDIDEEGAADTAPLQYGDNRIIAGGADSPVRFNLRLRRQTA